MLADREEDAGRALVGQRLEDGGRILRPRTVVKGQHDLLVAQEVELLEMLEAETRPTGGVDLDDAADPERIRIGAGYFCRGRRCGGSRSGCRSRLGIGLGGRGLRPRRSTCAK